MKYKALMLDLDGTTVPNKIDGMPSKKVTEIIAKAKDYIHVGIATGRHLELVQPIVELLQLSGPVILLGGAQILDMQTGVYLQENIINKKDLHQLFRLLKPFNVPIYIYERNGNRRYKEGDHPNKPLTLLVDNVYESQADEIITAIADISTISAHKLVSWSKGKMCIDISNASSTKQHAVLEVARILDIKTEEIIGVGDGYNDFPLLMACGLKVAMGNAVPELKAIADYIAPSVEDDGVADVIEKFVLRQHEF